MMAGYQTLFIYGPRASQQFEALRVKFSFRHDGIILDRTRPVQQPDSGLWKYQEVGTSHNFRHAVTCPSLHVTISFVTVMNVLLTPLCDGNVLCLRRCKRQHVRIPRKHAYIP